jgi:hypothetical protein
MALHDDDYMMPLMPMPFIHAKHIFDLAVAAAKLNLTRSIMNLFVCCAQVVFNYTLFLCLFFFATFLKHT